MLKKLFYVGLGISIIVAKKSVSFILAKRPEPGSSEESKSAAKQDSSERTQKDILAEATADIQSVTDDSDLSGQKSASSAERDDLTAITGIGPTYAKRLQAAGITTYSVLSRQSPEKVYEVAQLRGQMSEAVSWISQAAVLAA